MVQTGTASPAKSACADPPVMLLRTPGELSYPRPLLAYAQVTRHQGAASLRQEPLTCPSPGQSLAVLLPIGWNRPSTTQQGR